MIARVLGGNISERVAKFTDIVEQTKRTPPAEYKARSLQAKKAHKGTALKCSVCGGPLGLPGSYPAKRITHSDGSVTYQHMNH